MFCSLTVLPIVSSWIFDSTISREQGIKLIQYMKTNLGSALMISAPLVTTMIAESLGATIYLKISQSLVKGLRRVRRLFSVSRIVAVATLITALRIPSPGIMSACRVPSFFPQECQSIRSIQSSRTVNKKYNTDFRF